MLDQEYAFLKELVEAPSPSGFEEPAAAVYRSYLEPLADCVETNVLGSVHAKLAGTVPGAPSVVLAGHIDEIGMMVNYITDEGYITFVSIGGVDAAVLPALRVDVHTADGPLLGVLGRKPYHILEREDREKVTKMDKLFIDLGLPADEVKRRVKVGDPITIHVGMEKFGDDLIVSRALDDKMGAWIAARVLEEVKRAGGPAGDLIVAGTIQEEIGLRGGQTSAYAIDPDIFIAVEVGHATDYPDIDNRKFGQMKVGFGPCFGRGANINKEVLRRLEAAAAAEGLDYQINAEPSGTGTDANTAQISRGGIATALVSIPNRYMHTPTEVVSLRDLDACVRILTRFVLDLTADVNLIP
ncbi:MAG: M20/M25/M40 family metallo-hydrolase [Actinomycetes bacterium]|jgi:endoglucanase|nr:M20/M25/M40 family metallo-hydrolase [Actinomycetes bacterium]